MSRSMPKVLRTKVRRHFVYFYQRRCVFDESEILGKLPQLLRTIVVRTGHAEILKQMPFFNEREPIFISSMQQMLRPCVFSPGDVMTAENSIGTHLFFILSGEAVATRVIPRVESAAIMIGSIRSGCQHHFFGELPMVEATTQPCASGGCSACEQHSIIRPSPSPGTT